jgi:hypothetical protein
LDLEEKWPVPGRHSRAAEWLRMWEDLGRAPRTIDAYARGLAEYLQVCEREGAEPADATRAHVVGTRPRPAVPGGAGCSGCRWHRHS